MARVNGGTGRVVVAVIGAGIMGSAMARHLAAAGPDHTGMRQAPPLLAALSGQWRAAVAAGSGRQDSSAGRLALASPSPAN
jgi:glycine/D-amino acid oxidase-like deaminating enzyme